MKRVAVVMALVITVFSFGTSDISAETPNGPKTFVTRAACEAALESGDFQYYMPKYYGLKNRNPVDGITLIRVPLEYDLCIKMQVVGGRKFVVQKEGTVFRAHPQRDGSLALAYRDDCGNAVYESVLPPPPVVEVEPEPAPVRAPVYGPPPPMVEKVVYREREIEERRGRKKWPWLLAGGLLAGGGYAAYYYWPCPPGTQRK